MRSFFCNAEVSDGNKVTGDYYAGRDRGTFGRISGCRLPRTIKQALGALRLDEAKRVKYGFDLPGVASGDCGNDERAPLLLQMLHENVL